MGNGFLTLIFSQQKQRRTCKLNKFHYTNYNFPSINREQSVMAITITTRHYTKDNSLLECRYTGHNRHNRPFIADFMGRTIHPRNVLSYLVVAL